MSHSKQELTMPLEYHGQTGTVNRFGVRPERNFRDDLSAEYVRSILAYNPWTGEFRWRWRADRKLFWNRRYAGKRAGSFKRKGRSTYVTIGINGKAYYASRLAWLLVTGEWPKGIADHSDTEGTNNRFANLREATRTQNNANARLRSDSTTGLKGATWNAKMGRYTANIGANGKLHYLGRYDTAEEAHAAYMDAAVEYHGEFARAA